MAIIRWEPFRMEDMPEFRLPKFGTNMAVDVYEEGKNVVAEMHLPGMNPENIDIEIEDDYVSVSGTRVETKEEDARSYYYQEIQRGSFKRSFRLPSKVNADKATAEYDEGILTLSMPKIDEKKSKKVRPKTTPKDDTKKKL